MRDFTSSPTNLIGIAVSTMNARLLHNVELIEQLSTLGWPVVIVNQHTTQEGKLDPEADGVNRPHMRVIQSTQLGLSHSRNQAMEELQKQSVRWAVLCDDDVTLDLGNARRWQHGWKAMRRLLHGTTSVQSPQGS